MIKRFGQVVELTIYGKGGETILSTNLDEEDGIGLRVDFDLHLMKGFNRGTIKVYNLSTPMIKELSNGERFVSLRTKLHDVDNFLLVDKWFISNSLEEKLVPNSVLSLFCYDNIRKTILEKSVKFNVVVPKLKNIMNRLMGAAEADPNIVKYKHFTPELLNWSPLRPDSTWNGSVMGCLESLRKPYHFDFYTQENNIILMHRPILKTVASTDIAKEVPVVLDTNNMRANPKLSPAQMQITSNLDGKFNPTNIIDSTKLLVVGLGGDERATQVTDDYINKTTLGYPLYQIITVQHRGSNYTPLWETILYAVAPSNSQTMRVGSAEGEMN